MEYAFCQYNYTSPLYFVVFLCTKNSQNYKILILFEIIFYFCLSLDTLRRFRPRGHPQGNPPHPPHPRGRPVTEIMDTVGTILLLFAGSRQAPRVVIDCCGNRITIAVKGDRLMNGGGAICIGTVRPLVTSVIHQILHGIVCYSCPTIPNSHTILPDNSWGTNTLNILSLQRGIPSALVVRQ